jgi:hypothetical protein
VEPAHHLTRLAKVAPVMTKSKTDAVNGVVESDRAVIIKWDWIIVLIVNSFHAR